MHAGNLVSDELVNRLVEERIARPDCSERIYSGWISADLGSRRKRCTKLLRSATVTGSGSALAR